MRKSIKKIITWARINFDLVLGAFFFLTYRYYFTWLLWRSRGVPPEPDDSYYYLAHAANFPSAVNFEAFRLLPFSLWINLIKIITGTSLETSYMINFYLGPPLMFLTLAYFLIKVETDKKVRLLLFTLLALYSGSGAYHGFFWVVPSFYQLILFFLMLTFIFSDKKFKLWQILPFSAAFIFVHPTSIFISAIFLIYPLFLYFFKKELSYVAFKNTIPVLTSLLLSFMAYLLIGFRFPHDNSPESFQTIQSLLAGFIKGNINLISLQIIWKEYFSIFFLNPVTIIVYFTMFYFVYRIKQYKIIAVYLSTLLLVLLSTTIPYGSRTLGFLWPITFLVIGYFLVGIWKMLHSISPKFKLGYLTIIPFAVLFTLASIFNVISVSSVNATKNYNWNRSCPLKLQDKNIYFTAQESKNAFSLYEGDEKALHFLSIDKVNDFSKEDNMLVETKNEKLQPSALSGVEDLLASMITRRGGGTNVQYPSNSWTVPPADSGTLLANLNSNDLKISQYLDCGHFQVSIIEKL